MGGRHLRSLPAALVALLTFVVYLPALKGEFINWDDTGYVVNNAHIRTLDWSFVRWAFTDVSVSYWHPVAWLSHALDYALWGLRPAGHHLTSILLHAANTFLVVLLVLRLLEAWGGRTLRSGPAADMDARARLTAASVTGTLFGIHALHVESVAWVAERKDLLCAFFSLLSIMAYTSYVRGPGDREGAVNRHAMSRKGYYLLSLGLFALALMSKPMAVSLPAVLLLLDWCPYSRMTSWRAGLSVIGEKVPFAALSLISSIITLWAQKLQGAVVSLEVLPLAPRLLVAVNAPFFYLEKMVAPLGLTPRYPVPDGPSALSAEYLAAMALLIVVSAACIFAAKRRPVFLAVWAYYLVTLLPVLGIVRVGSVTIGDRFTYLPSLGPFLLAGLAAGRAWTGAGFPGRATIARWSLGALAVGIIIVLVHGTLRQLEIWRNDIVFWDRVIEADAGAVIAYNNRAVALSARGEADRALADLDRAIALAPRYGDAYVNRAMLFLDRGQFELAIEDYTNAIALGSSIVKAYNDRGVAYKHLGRYEKAIQDYSRAVELDPSYYLAYCNRGFAFGMTGQTDQAMADFTKAVSLRPDMVPAYLARGGLYRAMGEEALARNDLQMACDLGNAEGCAGARVP